MSGHALLPVHQDLANLDALAAGSEGILHGLSAADDADATQLLCKVDTDILRACGSDDGVLCKWQVAQASLHHLKQQCCSYLTFSQWQGGAKH